MMGRLFEDQDLKDKTAVFLDRYEAGKRLSQSMMEYQGTDALVLAIPSGGVPVGIEICESLSLDFDLMIVRKIQIPWNTEAGFGAVNLDGNVILNRDLVLSLHLTEEEVQAQIEKTVATLRKRERLFRKGRALPDLHDRITILVDDGLASGYTMLSALAFVRKRNPSKVIIAVPTGSYGTVQRLLPAVDRIYCLNVRSGYPYAVADAYREWYDLNDDEVLRMIAE
jgi:predicted phosphoribosyltransferase